ncbi:hypothetical protein BVC71_06840 [Marivivens niveibacter]|uniref:YjbH domain-containing protein n=1 Tax=Marivivens niveibacter TaxID=1930667 RepID=A0A251WZ36_9RHOB|nr:YjbH domain-containing protein [Marivivens niveibacter]OUD09561.1 hypothetical protein BVC71_06840 [Marivivens niveibacter]
MRKSFIKSVRVPIALAALGFAAPAHADDVSSRYSLFGNIGLIEMPTAQSAADADLAVSYSGFSMQQRTSIAFQITPRLSGTFRYTRFPNYTGPNTDETYDRSFDFRYRIFDETPWRPSFAIGLRDFAGTGLLTSEYVVATKSITDSVQVTAGLGWGRLGSYNGFTNPLGALDEAFETRPRRNVGLGGLPSSNQYFRGDAAFFGGVEWQINPQWTAVAEYSSDAYTREVANGSFDHKSPFNFGVTYQPNVNYQISAYSLYGGEIGLGFTSVINPTRPPIAGGEDRAPVPVAVRSVDAAAAATWAPDTQTQAAVGAGLSQVLDAEGISLNGISVTGDTVRLRYTNNRYRSEVQAMGRIARILTNAMPPSVEFFALEPMQRGIPLSQVTVARSDIETLENRVGSAQDIYTRANFNYPGDDLIPVPANDPAFVWGIVPYATVALFDSSNPAAFDVGIEASLRYRIQPNIIVAGSMSKSLYDDDIIEDTIRNSSLPPVRGNAALYRTQGDGGIDQLTLAWYGRPSDTLYSRLTFGYIEEMHAGLSTEVLWKPIDSRWAFGAELNYTAQRDFDMLFGVQDYDVMSGHLSAYWQSPSDFHVQIDAGRYLAGDWGATLSVNREFSNGWRVGAYATITDVPFDEFGEGSFDKGILLTIPTDWAIGKPSRNTVEMRLNSLTRDGGARLNVDGRLYDSIRNGHLADYNQSWGRFWR